MVSPLRRWRSYHYAAQYCDTHCGNGSRNSGRCDHRQFVSGARHRGSIRHQYHSGHHADVRCRASGLQSDDEARRITGGLSAWGLSARSGDTDIRNAGRRHDIAYRYIRRCQLRHADHQWRGCGRFCMFRLYRLLRCVFAQSRYQLFERQQERWRSRGDCQ